MLAAGEAISEIDEPYHLLTEREPKFAESVSAMIYDRTMGNKQHHSEGDSYHAARLCTVS